MADDKEIGARLAEARKAAGFSSAAAAAESLGMKYPTYAGHENGSRGLRANLERYARRFGVTVDWLLTGGKAQSPKGREASMASVPDLAIFAGMGGGGYLEVSVDEHGRPTDLEQVRGYWEFPEYMLRRFGNLRNVYAWEVRGDSMEPTLQGGAVVFVDTSQTVPPPDDIYAINYGDGLMVKRVKLIPRSDRVAIISDNERYGSDELLRDEVKIWGRVIGWFQWRG
jgi:phage repressor protein C with HTH and peptisase S24 domain